MIAKESVPQREKKLRGEAFEDIVIEELEHKGCRIAQRFQTSATGDTRPDLYAYCDGKLKRIEAKVALAWQKEGRGVRAGRFLLSPEASFKECYAFGTDDQLEETLAINVVRAEKPDEFIRTHGKYPKYPITEVDKIKDTDRCFPDMGTVVRPRADLIDRVKERMMNEDRG